MGALDAARPPADDASDCRSAGQVAASQLVQILVRMSMVVLADEAAQSDCGVIAAPAAGAEGALASWPPSE
jgi:hypothetical protein